MALPGCPETFQSVRSPFEQEVATAGEAQSSMQKMRDEHQQLHQFHQGDVIAVPAGVAHWLYNNGDSPVVAFTVIDTSNNANQLDPKRRVCVHMLHTSIMNIPYHYFDFNDNKMLMCIVYYEMINGLGVFLGWKA